MNNLLKVITTPSCWVQNDPYSKEWDEILNKLLDQEKFTCFNGHTAKIGGYNVWVENMPYASFTIKIEAFGTVRPKRTTIFKAYKKYVSDFLSYQMDKQRI